ncbi:spore germination protein [Cohnella rhizosphaerae]|uniref:Spore germination protein n=1 Tax=Cohnella rhizosphaerae TaxID=1457232 RepID=A0A9X4KPJ2_9BACL|nr:spore germination protein [Cohnella rhizosphaerae]MDG0808806.1 spore germination protein [Cohnella rhizosphaerae]
MAKNDDKAAGTEEKASVTLPAISDAVKDCVDCLQETLEGSGAALIYFPTLVDLDALQRDVIRPLSQASAEQLQTRLSGPPFSVAKELKSCLKSIMDGAALIYDGTDAYLYDAPKSIGRKIEQSETETVITGPHDGFVESLQENLGGSSKTTPQSEAEVHCARGGGKSPIRASSCYTLKILPTSSS